MSRRNDVDDEGDEGRKGPRGRRRETPSRSRRSRYSLGQQVAAWTSVALVGVLVAGSLVAYAKYRAFWDSITRVDVAGLLGPQPPKYNNAENILLIGSDTRLNQHGIGGSEDVNPGSRSDTLMLLHISPGHHSVTVVSIPRETMVPILSCPASDGTTGQQAQPGQEELINAALDFGGRPAPGRRSRPSPISTSTTSSSSTSPDSRRSSMISAGSGSASRSRSATRCPACT